MSRRYQGRRRGPSPRGFTGPGFGAAYRVLMPIRGREKREYFNGVSRWAVAGGGLGGAFLGYEAGGVLGATIGLGLGLTGSARFLAKHRFYRG